jgi:uncharacterized protein (DUF433 family)
MPLAIRLHLVLDSANDQKVLRNLARFLIAGNVTRSAEPTAGIADPLESRTILIYMHIQAKKTAIDWNGCTIVETNPRKVSGVPILKGTRVQADSIVENYEGGSPVEEIAENFGIPEATVREVLTFAARKENHFGS